MAGEEELRAVSSEPLVGGLGGLGVAGGAAVLLGLDQHLLDPGAAGAGRSTGLVLLPYLLAAILQPGL